jgi:hypothetical protein
MIIHSQGVSRRSSFFLEEFLRRIVHSICIFEDKTGWKHSASALAEHLIFVVVCTYCNNRHIGRGRVGRRTDFLPVLK